MTLAIAAGSVDVTPNNNAVNRRVRANAPAKPSTRYQPDASRRTTEYEMRDKFRFAC
jgi:hypothetical protein